MFEKDAKMPGRMSFGRDFQYEHPPDKWPRDGLETTLMCSICGADCSVMLYNGLMDAVFQCAPGTWQLYLCQGCGCAFLDPRPTQETIGMAYDNYYTHNVPGRFFIDKKLSIPLGGLRFALRNGYFNAKYHYRLKPALKIGFYLARFLPFRRMREDRLIRHMSCPRDKPRLLDVGCGNGRFLLRMRKLGWTVEGLDPDPRAAAVTGQAGLLVHQGMLDSSTFPKNCFDAVTMSHVIEHVHDPIATIRHCHRILRPGGFLWIATPNLGAQGHATYGEHWRGLEPPRHLFIFSSSSLKLALRKAGFKEISGPLPNMGAEWMFPASYAIVQGIDPTDNLPKPRFRQKWKARLADLRAVLNADLAEELILLARKAPEM